jgi:hypothetical protein
LTTGLTDGITAFREEDRKAGANPGRGDDCREDRAERAFGGGMLLPANAPSPLCGCGGADALDDRSGRT